jgi:RimJ/RimL family protein N-acetyltransferase
MYAIDLGDGAQLRPLEPWQAPEFLAHMDRARETVDPWIPWAARSTDLESATATLQRYADKAAGDTGRLYGIWLDGTLVGGVMFVHFDATEGSCEVGCWLEPAGYGRGLVTRAVRLIIDWAISVRGVHRVEWRCRSDNTASSNVARRLGMRREGVLRGDFVYLGVRHDTEVWSLLATD